MLLLSPGEMMRNAKTVKNSEKIENDKNRKALAAAGPRHVPL